MGDVAVPVSIGISVHASRHGVTKLSRTIHGQSDFLAQLFPDDEGQPIVRRAHIVKAFRPSPGLLARYRGLSDISPDEWYEFFGKTAEPWSDEDREYLVEWWGRDDVLSLSYALERPPWGLQREVCRLRRMGVEIAYLREER